MPREMLVINTTKKEQIVDITEKIDDILKRSGAVSGWAAVFLAHTTAALVTTALDPNEDIDILDSIETAVPGEYAHLHRHAAVPHHIIASFLNSSLLIPVQSGKLLLGEMQRIALLELNGPKARTIVVEFLNREAPRVWSNPGKLASIHN